ncbi:MAG: hypothetical protein IJR46_05870, partial [Neisseriaceae bacterium]|nr:hypothetical protein [Neisseriaceae bacterium]
RPAMWLHFYKYVADKIQDGKLNLSKPIPNHQLTQIINQYAEQKQSSKPSQTPNTPKKHKR